MASLNRVMLIGNLTRDPEIRYLANGQPMARIGLAVSRSWKTKDGKTQESVSFFNLVAFEKRAEILAKHTRKGHRLFVEGELQARTVTNDKGEQRTFHDIRVNGFQFLTNANGQKSAADAEAQVATAPNADEPDAQDDEEESAA